MIEESQLRLLVSGRWLIPLMAHLGAAQGSRFAAMLAQIGPSRSALAASLEQLREAGWVERNPGHGHPLRPEYVLTEAGAPIAAFAERVMESRERLGLEPGQLSRWSLPIAARLRAGDERFTGLRHALAPVTPRALSLSLKQMMSADLVGRSLESSFPPIPIYGLTSRGRRLAEALH
jgi:DNA-binding HxlR family transcriptional regulator